MTGFSEKIVERSMRWIAACLAAGRLKTIAGGIENLPERGPALIVARHYHHLFDGLMLFAAIQRRFHIVVTLDWVNDRGRKFFFASLNRMARWPMLLRSDVLIGPVQRSGALFSRRDVIRYQRRALRQSVELLMEGRLVVIFPEGFPNIDPAYTPKTDPEQFLPFKPGFVSILGAAEAHLGKKIPIIPAGVRYQPGNLWTGYLNFGQAIYREETTSRAALIERVETEVKNLSAGAGIVESAALRDIK